MSPRKTSDKPALPQRSESGYGRPLGTLSEVRASRKTRYERVIDMILQGRGRPQIAKSIAKEYKISKRQAYNDIHAALMSMSEHYQPATEQARIDAIVRLEGLFERAIDMDDTRTAVAVQAQLSALTGVTETQMIWRERREHEIELLKLRAGQDEQQRRQIAAMSDDQLVCAIRGQLPPGTVKVKDVTDVEFNVSDGGEDG
jgi:hypothetical protein